MSNPGRPPHVPTDDGRSMVRRLAAVGARHEDIALKMGFSSDTLTRHYRKELDDGRIDANAVIAGTLYEQARMGNITAAIFWLKTRAGWRETDRLELSGPEGGAIRLEKVARVIVDPSNPNG